MIFKIEKEREMYMIEYAEPSIINVISDKIGNETRFLKAHHFASMETFVCLEFVYSGNGRWNYRENAIKKQAEDCSFEDIFTKLYTSLGKEKPNNIPDITLLEEIMDKYIFLFAKKDKKQKIEFRNEGDLGGWGFRIDEIRSTTAMFQRTIHILQDIAEFLKKNPTISLRERMIELYKGHYEQYNKVYGIPMPTSAEV